MDTFRKTIGIIDEKLNFHIYFLFFLIIISMFLEMLSIGSLIPFFDVILSNEDDNFLYYISAFLSIDKNLLVQFSLIFLAIVFILKTFLVSIIIYYKHNFILKLNINLARRIIYKITNTNKHLTLKDNNSEYHRLILIDSSMVANCVYQIINISSETTIIVGSILVLLYYEPFLLAIFLLFSILIYISYHLFLKKNITLWGNYRKINDTSRRKYLSDLINTGIFSKLLGLKNSSSHNFEKTNNLTLKYYQLREMWNEIPRNLLEMVAIFFILILFFYFLINKIDIKNTIPILSLFSLASLKIVMSLNRIIISLNQIFFAKTSINKINSLIHSDKNLIENNSKLKRFENLKFENITFNYNNNVIFKDLNLNISKNSFIGIKGKSGSGKSTLLYLIIGLINQSSGNIILNNKFSYKTNRVNIGFVSQQPFLINDSIRKNIAFGVNPKNIDDNKIKELIKLLKLDDLINKSKNGLNLIIEEKSSNISLGQVQRIAIARCLYFNPDILVFDEPTSSLDKSNEENIIRILNKLKNKKTIIISSHSTRILSVCSSIVNLDRRIIN
tara:strand:+ start:17456 stop:19132 length:1677 start_codon:yes stop_codon:yes gene_type:complete